MGTRFAGAVLLTALVLTACSGGSGSIDLGGPADLPAGQDFNPGRDVETVVGSLQFTGDPLEITVDGVAYLLGLEEAGCVGLEVRVDGTSYIPRRECENAADPAWEWHRELSCVAASDSTCDVPVPRVSFGHLRGDPDLVCLTVSTETGFGDARFVELSPERLYLAARPEEGQGYTVFAYTADGMPYGEPPLDGPANAIYALCDRAYDAYAAGDDEPQPAATIRATIVIDVDDSWLSLGPAWALNLFYFETPDTGGGASLDFGYLSANPGSQLFEGGFYEAGQDLLVGIHPVTNDVFPDGPGWIAVPIPSLPDPADLEFGEPVMELSVGPGVVDPPTLDPATIELRWRTAG